MKRMMRTACVPLVISVLLYLILPAGGEGELDLTILSALKAQFVFHPLVLLPIVLLLALLLFRVKVTQAILCSVAAAVGCMIWVQQVPWQQLPQILWGGYHNAGSVVSTAGSAAGFSSPELATMMDGGGVVSMLEVSAVVLISTSYSGIFEETGLMKGVTRGMKKLARRVSRFGAVLSASILSGMLSCNQSLSILLTRQLCDGIYDSPEDLAIGIENGAVVTSSLIPWNIAGSIPLAMIGGSEKSLWFAFYLIAIPAWNLLLDLWKEKRGRPLQV